MQAIAYRSYSSLAHLVHVRKSRSSMSRKSRVILVETRAKRILHPEVLCISAILIGKEDVLLDNSWHFGHMTGFQVTKFTEVRLRTTSAAALYGPRPNLLMVRSALQHRSSHSYILGPAAASWTSLSWHQ